MHVVSALIIMHAAALDSVRWSFYFESSTTAEKESNTLPACTYDRKKNDFLILLGRPVKVLDFGFCQKGERPTPACHSQSHRVFARRYQTR